TEERDLRLAGDGAGAIEVLPALEREQCLLGEIVVCAGDVRRIEVSELGEAELDAAHHVRVVVLARLGPPGPGTHAEPGSGDVAAFGRECRMLLVAERGQRRRDLPDPRALRLRRPGAERGAREAREPRPPVRTKRPETRALGKSGADALSPLELRRPLREL